MAVTNEDEFRAWLEEQPREVCVAIAYRAAMRVLPLAMDLARFDGAEHLALVTVRASLTSGVAAVRPTPYVKVAANAANAAGAAAYADTARDLATLAEDGIPVPGDLQAAIEDYLSDGRSALAAGGPWTFWAKWYRRAMAGDPLPWDLQERIATEIEEDVWEAGPEAVAEEIARIEGEIEKSSFERPETVPETKKSILREIVNGLLAEPVISAEFALSSAETIQRAVQQYLNDSGENRLPEELQSLDLLEDHFKNIARVLERHEETEDAENALVAEIEALNIKVARLEADLKDARSKSLEGRFKAAAIENLGKTVTSPWMIGALGYGACHFFGWTPGGWTLANLRGYADDLLKHMAEHRSR